MVADLETAQEGRWVVAITATNAMRQITLILPLLDCERAPQSILCPPCPLFGNVEDVYSYQDHRVAPIIPVPVRRILGRRGGIPRVQGLCGAVLKALLRDRSASKLERQTERFRHGLPMAINRP
jgi:hypothetical protein